VCLTLEAMVGVLWRMGKYEEAEPFAVTVFEIYEGRLGADHVDVGIMANNLAMLFHAQKKYAEAEQLYKRALGIRTKRGAPKHKDVKDLIANYIQLLEATGRKGDAEKLRAFSRSLVSGRWNRRGVYEALKADKESVGQH